MTLFPLAQLLILAVGPRRGNIVGKLIIRELGTTDGYIDPERIEERPTFRFIK